MKNKKFKRSLWIFLLPCLIFTTYCLLSFMGCGLNNPFTPPTPRGPTLTYPQNGKELGTGETPFIWDKVPGKEQYQFQLSKSATFTSFVVNITDSLFDSRYEYEFSDTDTTEYFWRAKVQYRKPNIWSEWSDVWSLLICPGMGNHPPVTPYNPSPPDNATDISTELTLSWISGDPDEDIITYTIYIDKDNLFPSLPFTTIDSSKADTTTVLYELPTTLDTGTVYYWKVEARDQHTMSAGPIWRFTTSSTPNEPPDKPQTPTGPSWIYADKSCTFTTSTTDPDGDNVQYMFDFGDGTISNWTTLVPSGTSGNALHIYTRLGTFYVKARAKDEHSAISEWSDSVSILVKGDAGTCWVAGNGDAKVIRISAKGSILCEFDKGVLAPVTLDVDPLTGWCWEASTYDNRVHRISPACDTAREHTFKDANASAPCIDGNGYCWYVFMFTKKLIKVDETFIILKTIDYTGLSSFTFPIVIAIDIGEQALWSIESNQAGNGSVSKFLCSGTTYQFRLSGFNASWADVDQSTHCCWVADFGNNRVAKIPSDGTISNIKYFTGFNQPSCVSVDSYTHCCWVADELNNRVVKLSEDGTELCETTEVTPFAVEADPLDHGCWASDRTNGKVVKLDANCNVLFTVDNIFKPAGLSVNPNPDP